MLDNSSSTAIKKEHYQGAQSYRNVLNKLQLEDSSSINFDLFLIGSDLKSTPRANPTMDEDQTNLSDAVQFIIENTVNAKAAILISDGIYTQGKNPVFDAAHSPIPVFTIGLGDTTSQKDMVVRSVTAHSSGYLNTNHPVSATISAYGFDNQSFRVNLQKDQEIIASKTITPKSGNSVQNVSFKLPLKKEGLQQFSIVIPQLSGEWTAANNARHFVVDVLDDRQQVLSIAFEVHPDVGFVRSLLLRDQHIQPSPFTWLGGERFIEGPLAINADTIDLAIIHGYPSSGLPESVQQKVAQLAEKVPLIIAATPQFDPRMFSQEIGSLPVQFSAPRQVAPVTLSPANSKHSILELSAIHYDQAPSLFAPVNNLELSAGSEAIFNSKFQGQVTSTPVLTVQQLGNKRRVLFTGFGWYRYQQNENVAFRTFVNRLWMNAISWSATDPNDQNLKVKPEHIPFSETEPVVLTAYLKNERGEMESGAVIDFSVSSTSVDSSFYSMENSGAGEYRLNLGQMPEGVYSFHAVAKKEGRTLGAQTGEFVVARSNAEFMNMERNNQLLQQLALRTGGTYSPFDSISGFWNQLHTQGLLNQTQEVKITFWYPYQHLFWFVIVVILLSAEWIFRKYLTLP